MTHNEMPKETLLTKLQREARETNERHHRASYGHILPEESLQKAIIYWNERTDTLIANTLTQAAEEIQEMGMCNGAIYQRGNKNDYLEALTDAQKVLLGDTQSQTGS